MKGLIPVASEKRGGTRKIADYNIKICRHSEHNPPMHRVYEPGVYEHECPGCGTIQNFTITSKPTLSFLKNVFLFPIFAFLISCNTQNAEVKSTDVIIKGCGMKIYVIDSCEYIGISSHEFSHKGNCMFCQERNRKMIQQELENSKRNF